MPRCNPQRQSQNTLFPPARISFNASAQNDVPFASSTPTCSTYSCQLFSISSLNSCGSVPSRSPCWRFSGWYTTRSDTSARESRRAFCFGSCTMNGFTGRSGLVIRWPGAAPAGAPGAGGAGVGGEGGAGGAGARGAGAAGRGGAVAPRAGGAGLPGAGAGAGARAGGGGAAGDAGGRKGGVGGAAGRAGAETGPEKRGIPGGRGGTGTAGGAGAAQRACAGRPERERGAAAVRRH